MNRQVFLKFRNVKGFLGVKKTVILPLSSIRQISVYNNMIYFHTNYFFGSNIQCNFRKGTTEDDVVRHITNQMNSGKTIINFED